MNDVLSLPVNFYHRLKPWKNLLPQGFPILMYHKMGFAPLGTRYRHMAVSKTLLEKQIRELKENGYRSASLDEVAEKSRGLKSHGYPPPPAGASLRDEGLGATPPFYAPPPEGGGQGVGEKRICITFDDGYASVLEQAMPILNKYNFRAIIYLVPNLMGQRNEWDVGSRVSVEKLMNREQAAEWLKNGHEIGAHTLTHAHLHKIPLAEAKKEIFESKARLEEMFSQPVKHFCYPYGDYNLAVRDLAAEAGFSTATTTKAGLNFKIDDPFQLERITARTPPVIKLKEIWRRLGF